MAAIGLTKSLLGGVPQHSIFVGRPHHGVLNVSCSMSAFQILELKGRICFDKINRN